MVNVLRVAPKLCRAPALPRLTLTLVKQAVGLDYRKIASKSEETTDGHRQVKNGDSMFTSFWTRLQQNSIKK